MKNLTLFFAQLSVSLISQSAIQEDLAPSNGPPQDNSRIEALDRYWAALAKAAKEGNFEGMQSLYHKDAVLVKPDTTIAISEAFKYRWKKEIMEVKNGQRANALEFRFSKRIGNEITAYEQGIYHYTSINTSNGDRLGDAYIHFETLLVKVNDQWVALMEYQKEEASLDDWKALQ